MYLQAEQAPDEPPMYVLGIEFGVTEQWVRLRAVDLRLLITAARTLLGQRRVA